MKIIKSALLVMAFCCVFFRISYAALNDGLIAYWPFNGNANDESGNGNNAIVNGATLSTDRFGNPNSAYTFDGVNDYINIGNNVKPPFPITVSLWVKSGGSQSAYLFRNDRLDSGSYRNGIAVSMYSDGAIGCAVFDGFSAGYNRRNIVSNSSVVSDQNWHHFVAVFNSLSSLQLFWDSQEISGTYDGTGSRLSYSSADGAIGLHNNNGPVYFEGDIDDLRVYNRALSASEIGELFTPPPFTYYLPYFKVDPVTWNGLGLRNTNNTQSAQVMARVYGKSGAVILTENITVPARGQRAILLGSGLTNEGWIYVESTRPLGGLGFVGEGSKVMADIPFADNLSKKLLIPHVAQNQDWDSTIIICNPNDSVSNIALTYVNSDGSPLFTQYHTVPANGSASYDLIDLVQQAVYNNGSVEISSSQGIVAFALYRNFKVGGGCYNGINAIDVADQ